MLKKFYIVKDYKDLLSGQVIPQKILNYLPFNTMMPMQMQMPIPIPKIPGISIPIDSPSISPVPMPMMSAPLIASSQIMAGPPIIKLTPMINQNVPGTIKIIGDNYIFTLNIPYRYLRNVINDIYYNAHTNIDKTKPMITFRIITPTIDSSVSTTFDKMLEIIKNMQYRYSDIRYITPDGQYEPLNKLINIISSSTNSTNDAISMIKQEHRNNPSLYVPIYNY